MKTASDLSKLVAALRAQRFDPSTPLDEIRSWFNDAGAKVTVPSEVRCSVGSLAGIPVERLVPPQPTGGRTILYLHGGGYGLGSVAAARPLAARLALATSAVAVSLEYRLAPEHPCPAAIEDATAAYQELVRSEGDPGLTAMIGDSAGGGLVVATLVALRNVGVSLPRAAVCISPWVDLRLASASVRDAPGDPEVPFWFLERLADYYLGGRPADDPMASPLLADLRGLPPLLIQAGTAEALLDDATALATAARAADVNVTLEQWEGMIHIWHRFAPRLPEANQALDRIGTWLSEQWSKALVDGRPQR